MASWVALILLVIAGGCLMLRGEETIAGLDLGEVAMALGILGATLFLTASLLRNYKGRLMYAARDVLLWLGLSSVMIGGYNFRDELMAFGHRVAGDLALTSPPRAEAQPDGERAVRIRRRADGHFVARADFNGTQLSMLVDTGASTVVLKPADAQKIGIDVEKLKYTVPVQTANGTTFAAHVRIKRLAVGTIAFGEVEALVAKPGTLKDSLLGMSFLNRLRSYEFAGEYLTLRI